jgi:hypothetical protein
MSTPRFMNMATLGLLVLAAVLALPPAQAQATNTTSKSKSAKARKPPVDKGPAESRTERDKRLQRECKGKPNTGACEGYGG